MSSYTIWIEGYAATRESGTARCLGTVEAVNFVEAARELWKQNYLPVYKGDPHAADDYFNVGEDGIPRIWGCRCFDNEADARKSFG